MSDERKLQWHPAFCDAMELTLREELPKTMFKDLGEEGAIISSICPGIYRAEGKFPFAAQVIVTGELPQDSFVWLKALTRRMDVSVARRLVSDAIGIEQGTAEWREAEGVLHVAANANVEAFERLKEDDPAMSRAYEVLLRDEIEQNDLNNIRNIMDSFRVSVDVAMSALKIAPEKRERYAKLIAADAEKNE